MLELDVHMSKDKQVVVCHDGDLSRITDGKGCVSDYDHSVSFVKYIKAKTTV